MSFNTGAYDKPILQYSIPAGAGRLPSKLLARTPFVKHNGVRASNCDRNHPRTLIRTLFALGLCGFLSFQPAYSIDYPAPVALPSDSQADVSNSRRDGPLTIAFLPPASTLMFYQPIGQGIRHVIDENEGKLVYLAPTDGADTFGQAGMIQDAIGQNVDAIIITAHDEHAVAPLLKRGVDAGIITVLVNSDIPSFPTPVHAVVGYSQRAALCSLGKWISAQATDKPLEIGYLEGMPGYHNSERLEGFRSGLDPTKATIVQTLSGGWTVDRGNIAAMDLLQMRPGIDAIVASNDDMAMGAVQAARALRKDLIITGVDGQKAVLQAVESGSISATVDAQPYEMGQIAAQVVIDIAQGKSLGGYVATPIQIRAGGSDNSNHDYTCGAAN